MVWKRDEGGKYAVRRILLRYSKNWIIIYQTKLTLLQKCLYSL